MKHLGFGVVLVCLVAVPALAQSTSERDDPIITIDGSKNPELIPDWAAWLEAFRFMAAPAVLDVPIPTSVWVVTSPAQRALIREEALRVIAREDDVYARAVKLREGLTAQNALERQQKADAYEMQRRQLALDGRDNLLAALPADVQNALRGFVEEMRKGYKVRLPKSQLTQFRLPL